MFIRLGGIGLGTPHPSPDESDLWNGYSQETFIPGDRSRSLLILGGFGISGPFLFEEAARCTSSWHGSHVRIVNLAGSDGTYESLQWTDADRMVSEADRALTDLVKETGSRPVLIGFSTGALVAGILAGRRQRDLLGCALISPPLRMRRRFHESLMRFAHFTFHCPLTYPLFWWWRWFWMRTPAKNSDSLTERQRNLPQMGWTPGASSTSIRSLQRDLLSEAHAGLTGTEMPMLFLHGLRDGKAEWRETERFASAIAGASTTFVPFADSGHTISIGREAALFDETLCDWLDRLWTAGS